MGYITTNANKIFQKSCTSRYLALRLYLFKTKFVNFLFIVGAIMGYFVRLRVYFFSLYANKSTNTPLVTHFNNQALFNTMLRS